MTHKSESSFDTNRKLRKLIGDIVIECAKIEWSLAFCIEIFYKKGTRDLNLPAAMQLSLKEKRDKLRELISGNTKELFKDWEKIDSSIEKMNKTRNKIIHGLAFQSINANYLKSLSHHKGKFLVSTNYYEEDLLKFISAISELNTGKKGIAGIFQDKISHALETT